MAKRDEPSRAVFRFVYEIEAESELDARERLEELIAQEGFAVDLEGVYPIEDGGEDDDDVVR